ncbi:MAG: hypothetical protein AAF514_23210 [Verrucomicrobiota bacterium]
MTLTEVVDLTGDLDGVKSSVLINKETQAITTAKSGADEAFASQARNALEKVLGLARDLEISNPENFSLQSGKGKIHFFNGPKACVAILHEDRDFSAGVREKLTLVAREVTEML